MMYEILFLAILIVVLLLVSRIWKSVAKKLVFTVFAAVFAVSFFYHFKTDLEFSYACEDWLALQQGYLDADGSTVYRVITRSPEPVISLTKIRSPDEMDSLADRKPDIEQWLNEQEDVFSRVFGENQAAQEAYRWSWTVEGRIQEACAQQLAEPRRRVGYYALWSKAEIRDWFRQWRDMKWSPSERAS